jgi:hypothetical protein
VRTAHRIAACLALACGSPEKPADPPRPEVSPPVVVIEAAVGAPPLSDAGLDLDAADAGDGGAVAAAVPAASAPVSESPDVVRARLAALDMKATKFAAEPVPRRPPGPPPSRFRGLGLPLAPMLYRAKAIRMSDGLPPEIVVRTTRQNYGRFRLCFDNYARALPGPMKASVTTRFAIAASGEVVLAEPVATTIDVETTLCIARALQALSYPPPTFPLVGVEFTIAVVND